ncbi:MAG TPA: hypothetical protein VIM68_02530, partial [Thermoanaerobaculia bacterium]
MQNPEQRGAIGPRLLCQAGADALSGRIEILLDASDSLTNMLHISGEMPLGARIKLGDQRANGPPRGELGCGKEKEEDSDEPDRRPRVASGGRTLFVHLPRPATRDLRPVMS